MQQEKNQNKKEEPPAVQVRTLEIGKKFISNRQIITIDNIIKQPYMKGIFFAASWVLKYYQCPMCINFLPKLIQFYNQVNLQEKLLQIIYVGLQRNQEQHKQFIKKMPWISIPFIDQRNNHLRQFYNIRSIPQLISKFEQPVIDDNGECLFRKGKNDINSMGEDAYNKWKVGLQQFKEQQQKKRQYLNSFIQA